MMNYEHKKRMSRKSKVEAVGPDLRLFTFDSLLFSSSFIIHRFFPMHELSIAVSIVELAQEEADRRGGVRVDAVHLRLGPLAGVVKEALLGCYDMASAGTPMAGSRLIIEDVPIMVYCPQCQAPRLLSSMQRFCCPECNTPTGEIVQGKELEVVALEIEE
jgi:hydrogenase nickel incorporation protein HypA/HybF